MGLVIAFNLQAIVQLSARRRLYVHGHATLSDTTWGVGIMDALCAPRLLLKDSRRPLAVLVALVVLVLEVLTVLQTQPGDSCSFEKSSSWEVQKLRLGCVDETASALQARQYVSEAVKALRDVDLDVGIPVNTDIYENSLLSGKAVTALKSKEQRYVASLISSLKVGAVASINGLSLRRWEENSPWKSEGCGEADEGYGYYPLDLKYTGPRGQHTFVSTTGFISTFPCANRLIAAVCRHEPMSFAGDIGPNALQKVSVDCAVYETDREGRQTDPGGLADIIGLSHPDDIDGDTVRKAMLVAIVAENSVAEKPCERFVAVPKPCTVLGWVSLAALVSLGIIFWGSIFVRLGLKFATRSTVNWNGSTRRLVLSVFENLDAGSRDRRVGINDVSVKNDDLHISVVQSRRDLDHYNLTWTRAPAETQPSTRVRSDRIVQTFWDDDEDEIPLV